VSLGIECRTTKTRLSRMYTGLPCCSGPLRIIQASFGHRIRDQGVGGSNPLSPTNPLKHLQPDKPDPFWVQWVATGNFGSAVEMWNPSPACSAVNLRNSTSSFSFE